MDKNLNVCDTCLERGKLVMCDSCPRSYHMTCLDNDALVDAICEKEFHCGKCTIPISDKALVLSRNSYDVYAYAEQIKRNSKLDYEINAEFYMKRARDERKASKRSCNRNQLCKDQTNRCAGILRWYGYRKCDKAGEECDHIIELRHGGVDDITNLQMLCYECHKKKSSGNCGEQRCF
jgi:5-methylcytosine-specific restriction endonuclease McrA